MAMAEQTADPAASARWYIVHTYSNFEKKAAEEIKRQAEIHGLDDLIFEVMVPTEDCDRLALHCEAGVIVPWALNDRVEGCRPTS